MATDCGTGGGVRVKDDAGVVIAEDVQDVGVLLVSIRRAGVEQVGEDAEHALQRLRSCQYPFRSRYNTQWASDGSATAGLGSDCLIRLTST